MSDFKLGWDKLRRLLSSPLTWTGIQTFTSLVATTADINGGTIDDTTVGETTPKSVRGTNKEVYITSSGSLSAAQCSGTIVSNYGMTDADCIATLPTAAEGLAFVGTLPAIRARYFRFACPAAQADKINLLVTGNWVAGSDDGYVGVASGYSGNDAISVYCAKVTDGGFEWFMIPLSGTWTAG